MRGARREGRIAPHVSVVDGEDAVAISLVARGLDEDAAFGELIRDCDADPVGLARRIRHRGEAPPDLSARGDIGHSTNDAVGGRTGACVVHLGEFEHDIRADCGGGRRAQSQCHTVQPHLAHRERLCQRDRSTDGARFDAAVGRGDRRHPGAAATEHPDLKTQQMRGRR
jgi:hypothetical protein